MADKTLLGRPDEPTDLGTDHTLAARSSPPVSGLDATMAPSVSGLDATIAPSSSAGVTIQAGRKPQDYLELLPIQRQHYVVGEELARGGMGRILTARDRRLGRDVAIKELLVDTPELRVRFEREARITARLQHPNIVNILEAGTWPSGDAFYVMKYVTGDSLDKVIAARSALADRLALLPNVIAAVDALAFAHDRQIIHRDLKPANVLVGKFGETVVIDWGLAKDLTDARDVELDAGPYRGGVAGTTMVGAVMGTPAYMPVEQARGEVVDARADVYSLGAMLYHVLAGQPPVTGRTADAILDAVIENKITPLDECVSGIPRDLLTIVAKAMARDAADRYATASELADDLKRFQTGKLVDAHRYTRGELFRRWVRKHRAAVTVGATFLVVLAVSSTVFVRSILAERDDAEEARDEARTTGERAQTRRVAAETLIDQLVTQLQQKLMAIGQLEVLVGLAAPISNYYDALGGDQLDDRQQQRRAEALHTLADIAIAKGKLDEAHLRLTTAERLITATADSPERDHSLDRNLGKQGDLEAKRGSEAVARGFYERGLVHSRRHLAAKTSVEGRYNVAAALSKLGEIDERAGKLEAALDNAKQVRAILQGLHDEKPDDSDRARDLSQAERRISNVLEWLGRLDEAAEAVQRGKALSEAALARKPDDASLQRAVAFDNHRVATFLATRGKRAEALKDHERANQLLEKLVANDPANLDRLRDLEVGYNKHGASALPDIEVAEAAFRKGLAIAERVHAKMPEHVVAISDLAFALANLGSIQLATKQYAVARTTYERAVELNKAMLAKQPRNVEGQADLGNCYAQLGAIAEAVSDPKAAEAAYRLQLAVYEGSSPDDAELQTQIGITHLRLGYVLLPRDRETALGELERGIEMGHAARDRWPDLPLVISGLADGYFGLAAAGQDPRANYQAAVTYYEQLVAKNAASEGSRANLAKAKKLLAKS